MGGDVPKIHFCGGLRIADREHLPGWAVCSGGEQAHKLRASGRQTDDPSKVTCRRCLRLMEQAKGKMAGGFEMGPAPTPPGKLPYRLTEAVRDGIVSAINEGVPLTRAGALFGIPEVTVFRWMRRGKEVRDSKPLEKWTAADSVFADFQSRVERARAEKIRRLVSAIEEAGHRVNEKTGLKDAQHLRWILERTEAKDFTPRTEQEVQVQVDSSDPKRRLAELIDQIGSKTEKE